MAGIQLSVSVNKTAHLVRKGLEDLAAETPKVGRQTIYDELWEARKVLAAPVPKVSYPVNWDSEKQMLAYFASNGFGKGIPYAPTGASSRAWKLIATAVGWRLYNAFAAAKYLFGDATGRGQSNIHKGRRPLFRMVMEKHLQNLPQKIQDNLRKLIKRVGL